MSKIKDYPFKIILVLLLSFVLGEDRTADALTRLTDFWSKHDVATTDDLHTGFFLTDSLGWVVTHSTGLVLHTTDGGKTWRTQAKLEAGYLESIFFVDKKLGWICGDKGRIYRTEDGGKKWHQIGENRMELFFTGIHFFNRNEGFVVGMNTQSRKSVLLESSDGGRTWNDHSTKVSGTGLIGSIKFLNKDVGFIAAFNSIFHTTNGGRTWNAFPVGQGTVIREITFLNRSTGWAVGHKGILVTTADQGQSWKRSNSFSDGLLRSVVFINEKLGFIAGDKDSNGTTLWQTNDGGKSWVKVQNDFPDIHQIIRTNKKVWLIGDSGTVMSRIL